MNQFIDSNRILVFAPHPDDDILGCGGSMAWHVHHGEQVKIVYLTSGESGSVDISKTALGELRESEARAAASVLGVEETQFLRWPDGYLAVERDYLQILTSLIRAERPNRVYLPHSQDAVSDHLVTHQLVMEAVRRAAGPWYQECPGQPWPVGTVLGYEIWTPITAPGLSSNISEYMEHKLTALRQHRSQLAGYAYDDAIAGLNRYRAVMHGRSQFCECFQLLKVASIMDQPAHD